MKHTQTKKQATQLFCLLVLVSLVLSAGPVPPQAVHATPVLAENPHPPNEPLIRTSNPFGLST